MGKVLRNDGIIIFSRMGSTRLPGKALLPLGKSTVLGCVINQLRCCLGGGELVVATSDLQVDDPIESFAKSQGVRVLEGSFDVIGDFVLYDILNSNIVRISGDGHIDAELVDMTWLFITSGRRYHHQYPRQDLSLRTKCRSAFTQGGF